MKKYQFNATEIIRSTMFFSPPLFVIRTFGFHNRNYFKWVMEVAYLLLRNIYTLTPTALEKCGPSGAVI